MKQESLSDNLEALSFGLKAGVLDEDYVHNKLIDYVYNHHKENTMKIFLAIQENERSEMKDKLRYYRWGIEESAGHLAILSKDVENKKIKSAKDSVSFWFNEENVAHIINTCRVIFPNAEYDGAAQAHRWIFDKFVSILKEHKHLYIEGGESRGWADNFGYAEYIDLVIEKHLK